MLGPFGRRDTAQEVCREWANETLGGVPSGVLLFVSAQKKGSPPPPPLSYLTVKMVKNHLQKKIKN
jgi:hypothetical protein